MKGITFCLVVVAAAVVLDAVALAMSPGIVTGVCEVVCVVGLAITFRNWKKVRSLR